MVNLQPLWEPNGAGKSTLIKLILGLLELKEVAF